MQMVLQVGITTSNAEYRPFGRRPRSIRLNIQDIDGTRCSPGELSRPFWERLLDSIWDATTTTRNVSKGLNK